MTLATDIRFGRHLVFGPSQPPAEGVLGGSAVRGLPCRGPLRRAPSQRAEFTTAAVVWLHGFGDEPEGWASALKRARDEKPQWKWVHLRGRLLPQTCYRGQRVPGWGDYRDEGCTRVGSVDYDSQDIVAEATLAEVHRIIGELESQDGVPPGRIAIGGFSMGATAAAECALRFPARLAGLVMLNGWLLPGARAALGSGAAKELRVLVSHGSEDEQVGFDCGEEAAKLLGEAGAVVRFEVQAGLPHVGSGFGPGKELAVGFLGEVLGPRDCAEA